jgi:hypothetical protein
MDCFSLDFWFKVCICIILAVALWRIMKLFLPFLEGKLPSLVVQIINILIWAGIAILCLIVLFFFLSCIWGLVSGTFGGGLRLPHSRAELPFHFATAAAGLPLLGWRKQLPRS